ARRRDHCGGRDPGMGRGDDLVARLQPEPAHRDLERIRPVRAGHALLHTQRRRPGSLERVHLRSADETRLGDHALHRLVDLVLDREVLSVEIDNWDFHDDVPPSGLGLIRRRRRAGLPAYTPDSVMSRVTTEPAPMTT